MRLREFGRSGRSHQANLQERRCLFFEVSFVHHADHWCVSFSEISKSSLVLPHQGSDPNSTNEVTTLEWNKAGSRLATGNYDGNFRVWDLQGNLLLKVQGHNGLRHLSLSLPPHRVTGPIFAIKWSSDSQYLLTASVDMTSVVWDANTGSSVASCTSSLTRRCEKVHIFHSYGSRP